MLPTPLAESSKTSVDLISDIESIAETRGQCANTCASDHKMRGDREPSSPIISSEGS